MATAPAKMVGVVAGLLGRVDDCVAEVASWPRGLVAEQRVGIAVAVAYAEPVRRH